MTVKTERRKDAKPAAKRPKAPPTPPGPSPIEVEVLRLRAALEAATARARPAATLTKAILLRLSPAEHKLISDRSHDARRPMSEWIRYALFGYDGPISPVAPGPEKPDGRQLALPERHWGDE